MHSCRAYNKPNIKFVVTTSVESFQFENKYVLFKLSRSISNMYKIDNFLVFLIIVFISIFYISKNTYELIVLY